MSFLEIKIGVPSGDEDETPSTGGGDAPEHGRRNEQEVSKCCGISYYNFDDNEDICTQSINPHHPGIRIWENLVVIFITITALLVMFMAAFDSTKLGQWLLVYFFDAVYMVDMILTFFTAYIDTKGILIRDKKSIMKRYFKTTFVPDLISVLPTDALVLILDNDEPWKTLTQLRLNRLVRIYKVLRHFEYRESELGTNTSRMRYLKYSTICVLSTHALTCAWYALACTGIYEVGASDTDSRNCANSSWAVELEHVIGFPMENATTLNAYVVSLYWAVATATSTGYGDIFAGTTLEKAFAIFAMMCGIGVFFGMLMGGMTSMMTNSDTRRASYAHRIDLIKDNLIDIGVATDLVQQTIGYYDYLWLRKKGVQDSGIYDGLPLSFQAEISHTTNSGILEKAPIFHGLGEGFLRMLSLNIKHMLFLPNQIIIKRGDVGSQMFFVHRGMVEILSEDDEETPVATLKSGKLFGEVSLIYSMPRTATIRAATHCDLMVLDKYDLNLILVHYPDINAKLQEQAKRRCGVADDILEKQDHLQNPHYRATQHRRSSYVPPAPTRRKSFVPEPTIDMASGGGDLQKESSRELRRRASVTRNSFTQTKKVSSITMTESVELLQTDQDIREDLHNFVTRHKKSVWRKMKDQLTRFKNFIQATTLEPYASTKQNWDSVVILVTILISVLYPYMASFTAYQPREGYSDTEFGLTLLSFSYIFDFILVVDILVYLRTNVITPHGQSMRFKDIIKHYCCTHIFVVDILCILPLEVICLTADAGEPRWRLFCLLRLNRVLKFVKVLKHLGNREEMLHASLGLTRAIKLTLYVTILSHWIACILYSMACFGDSCNSESWIVSWSIRKRGISQFNRTMPSTEYITSLYWAAATMTSTGYGDIRGETTHGRFIALCAMLVGLLVYGYCLALMAATLGNADAPKVRFQERLFGMRDFMRARELGLDLQERVIGYLSLLWERYRGEWMPGEDSLIHDMPLGLQQDIALEDAQKTLALVPLFKDTDDAFLRSLAMRCTTYMFNPGDIVVYAGDMGREMYCIRRGQVEIRTSDMVQVIACLGDGQYFGEIGMIFGDYRTATAVAKTHMETLMLTMDDLEDVLKGFPLLEDQFKQAQDNKQYLRELQKEAMLRYTGKVVSHKDQAAAARKSLADGSSIRLRMQKNMENKKSVTKFKELDEVGNMNEDYVLPFKECSVVERFLCKLLLKMSFLPTGRGLKAWTALMMVVVVVNSVLIPLQASFLHNSKPLWCFSYLMDIMCYINIYISFHIAYYNDENVLVTHPLSTARNYLRTNFFLDLLCSFPLEILVYAGFPEFTSDNVHLFALVRLNRLCQIYKLPLAFGYLESSVDKESGLIREVKFAFYTFIFINILTCTVFLMSCPPILSNDDRSATPIGTGHRCADGSWITYSGQNLTSATTWGVYVLSFYWATATTVSVGYGELTAFTDLEMVVCLIIMISGVLFFGYIIASVAASMANADAQRARFQEKLHSIKLFMQDQNISDGLQKRVIAHYNYVWLRTRGVDPDTLFNGLPYSLWGDVTLSLYKDIISKVNGGSVMGTVANEVPRRGFFFLISLFKDTEMSFIKMLSRCIKPMLFLKGEYVVKKHDIGQEMYFIHRGSVDVTSEDGTMVFDTMRPGAAFGEVALLFSCPRTACIRAKYNSDVFCLAKQDLDRVLDLYPQIKQQVMAIAEERRQQAQKRSAAKVEKKSSSETSNAGSEKSVASDKSVTSKKSALSQGSGASLEIPVMEPTKSNLCVPPIDSNLLVIQEEEEENSEGTGSNEEENIAVNLDIMAEGSSIQSGNDNGNNNQVGNRNRNNKEEDNEDANSTSVEIKTNCLYQSWQRLIKLNQFTIHPDSVAYNRFNNFLCVCSFVVCWLATVQATYQHHHPGIISLNYLCDLFFWIEIYINFHLSFVDSLGDLVDEYEAISSNYKRKLGYFALDLVSVFPFDILAFAAPAGDRMLALSYLRLTRLLRLIHLSRFFSKWEKELDVNMLVVRLTKSGQNLLHIVHFVACIWYAVACPLDDCNSEAWTQHLDSDDKFDRYCTCVYWAVATMTSTGYGDIHAYTQIEMVTASAVMVLGKLLFGFILGNIASTLSNAEANKVAYEEKLEAIRNTMNDQSVPWSLQHRVISYFDYIWMRNKGVDVKGLFSDAPGCLASELFLEIARPMFQAIPLFDEADESFFRQLCTKVQILLFMPGDFIVKKDDVGNEVMYLYSGEAEVFGDQVKDVLGPGDIFGEINLIRNLPRRVSVRALTHVDIFSLSRQNMEEVLEYYPTISASIMSIAMTRFRQILSTTEDHSRRLSKMVRR